jgi:peptidoglycan/LPS O-acetylase OafA/YrhL
MLLFTPFIDQLDSFFVKTIGFTIIYLSFGILLIHFLIDKNINNQLDNLFSIKLVNFISKIGVCSYSIYIIHTLVIFAVKFLPINNKIITFILVFVISIYTGFLITSKVENYFLDLRDKYYPKRL